MFLRMLVVAVLSTVMIVGVAVAFGLVKTNLQVVRSDLASLEARFDKVARLAGGQQPEAEPADATTAARGIERDGPQSGGASDSASPALDRADGGDRRDDATAADPRTGPSGDAPATDDGAARIRAATTVDDVRSEMIGNLERMVEGAKAKAGHGSEGDATGSSTSAPATPGAEPPSSETAAIETPGTSTPGNSSLGNETSGNETPGNEPSASAPAGDRAEARSRIAAMGEPSASAGQDPASRVPTPASTDDAPARASPPADIPSSDAAPVEPAAEAATATAAADSIAADVSINPGLRSAPVGEIREQRAGAQGANPADDPVSIARNVEAPGEDARETKVPVPIQFVYGESEFTAEGLRAAKLLLDYVRLSGFESITLSGHADERGTEGFNLELSRQRLQAVRSFLSDGGYTGEVTLLPKGESEPFDGVDRSRFTTEELYQLDRRVELRVREVARGSG